MEKIINLTRKALRSRGFEIVRSGQLRELRENARLGKSLDRLSMVSRQNLAEAIAALPFSMSQLNQDIFALEVSGWKRGGYFVEFGATNGQDLSNTWLLETIFGWTGILAEPGRSWRRHLESCGRACALDFDCVWSKSGEKLTFLDATNAGTSTIYGFEDNDLRQRAKRAKYEVSTVSLLDLLKRHGAPCQIDYLSIDTEGSEFEILNAFDFGSYKINCITVEHNHGESRAMIFELLTRCGYKRIHEEISEFDDFYILDK